MEYNTTIATQTITISGQLYTKDDILSDHFILQNSFETDLLNFLQEWFNDSSTIEVRTSGSTGVPKTMQVEKQKMMNSACLTCQFLGLQSGDSAMLCMPLQYIGAKMVVVRSLVAGLDLIPITPSSNPLQDAEATTFSAMTPMQVYESLKQNRTKLLEIKHLIIGGGAVDATLAKELNQSPNAIWSTYGMTETLSHIALRRINGVDKSEWYTPFEDVKISLSDDDTLVIHAPKVCDEVLQTNDIVEINNKGQFKILGRKDNVVNSGGVKIQIEEVEALLKQYLTVPFIITSKPDPKFGEILVLLLTQKYRNEIGEIQSICNTNLPTYWIPKEYIFVEEFPFTGTDKPDRKRAKELAEK